MARALDVSIDRSGRVLVAWSRFKHSPSRQPGSKAVRIRRGSVRKGLSGARTVGTSRAFVKLATTLADGGQAVVAWQDQLGHEGSAGEPTLTYAAIARTPRASFRRARLLERFDVRGDGRFIGETGIEVRSAVRSKPVIAWTGFDGRHFVVRTTGVSGGGAQPTQTVSRPDRDTILGGLVVGPDGRAVALGLEGYGGSDPTGPRALVAARRPPGEAAFGPTEQIVDAADGFIRQSAVGIDSTGRAVAAWNRSAPSNAPVGLETSTRER